MLLEKSETNKARKNARNKVTNKPRKSARKKVSDKSRKKQGTLQETRHERMQER